MAGTYNILLAGVGGQGVISAAGVLARAAVASGLEARMYGSYGMAQRGGMVSAHLRIGKRVLNAHIEEGQASLVIGLELTEAVRWARMLGPRGTLITADVLVPPVGKLIKDGGAAIRGLLESFSSTVILDVGALSGQAGPRGSNFVLLGAASSLGGFPVGAAAVEEQIAAEAPNAAERLLEAFRRGRETMGRQVR